MAANIACIVCGGTDFYKEFGFYYCKECQTQSQDIQERVFAVEDQIDGEVIARVRSAKKIQAQKKSDERLTSWECYNYILKGLVDELIQLGADVRLKKTVQVLWFRYLNTLEVTNSDNEPPKLNAFNTKIDAEIIYGKTENRKRKAKKRTPSPSSILDGVTDSFTTRRERSKNKRNFILSEYDVLSATLKSEDASLYNQSLNSLKSSEDTSKKTDKYFQYNKFAKKEILKMMSKEQLKEHLEDVNSPQKMTYRSFSLRYSTGPAIVSRVKIFALLYLGLLINKDNIQLGDLIRFVREGQLSYHYVRHFFPEDLDERMLNIKNWNENQSLLVHHTMRSTTAALAHFLDVTSCVPIQNLPHLCRRYCKELNLPDDTWAYCINLIGRVYPKMVFTKQSQLIPNYEGRVLSIIIFTLKLMFGLDGETEVYFSDFAQKINDLPENTGNGRMFVWNDWMYYINYRKLVLLQHHFPTTNLFCGETADVLDMSTHFLTSEYTKVDSEQLSRQSEILKTLLEKFRDTHCYMPQKTTFESSITPYRSYVETLISLNIVSESSGYLLDVLQSDFCNDSWRFLVHSFQYLKKLYNDSKVSLKHRGANNDIELVKFKNLRAERKLWRKRAKKEVLVQVSSNTTSFEDTLLWKGAFNFEDGVTKTSCEDILRNYNQLNKSSFKKHKQNQLNSFKKHENYSRDLISSHSESKSDDNSLHFHYNPYERYWLKTLNVNHVTNKEFLKFYQTFPKSFRDVMNECSRMSEQEPKELVDEFNDVEIYLCYVAKFSSSEKNDKVADRTLQSLITKSIKNW